VYPEKRISLVNFFVFPTPVEKYCPGLDREEKLWKREKILGKSGFSWWLESSPGPTFTIPIWTKIVNVASGGAERRGALLKKVAHLANASVTHDP
jgi:hypothetical protein